MHICNRQVRLYGFTLTFSAIGLCLLLPLLLFEFHVPEVHDGAYYFIAAVLFFWSKAKDVHGMLD